MRASQKKTRWSFKLIPVLLVVTAVVLAYIMQFGFGGPAIQP
jgi:hypothetical protein